MVNYLFAEPLYSHLASAHAVQDYNCVAKVD